jgi:putative nucleotidyltransferase with HDIG domain
MLIDAKTHSQIKPQRDSQGTVYYKEIEATLKRIRDTDAIVDSVYTMVKSDRENIWLFVVDSGDRQRGNVAYCGEPYDVSAFNEMKRAFFGPSVDRELTEDKWGVWLSGYAPIVNNIGQAVAIVGIDVSAKSIRDMQWLLKKRFLLILVLGILFSLFMGWFFSQGITQPLGRLMQGVRQVAKGNLEKKVVVKSSDEIGELAASFNKMTEELLIAKNKLHRYNLNTIKSLVLALEAKDAYTAGHSERVMHYSLNIAKKLGLIAQDIDLLQDACILHDIGKIGIPESILNKPAALNAEEERIIKRHPQIGENILRPIEFSKAGLAIVSDHHERPDGKGYPRGLKTEELSLLAEIVAVADSFDAMTTDRAYRKAMPRQQAMAILEENKGSQFDIRVVNAFLEYLKENG